MEEVNAAEIVLGIIFLFIGFAVIVGSYLFAAYVLYRVGRKFGVGSFGAYCVPIYNLVLICRCAGISGWVTAGYFAGALNVVVPELAPLFVLVAVGTGVYIWGSIARRLGKNFWGWGLGSAIVGIPVLFLAFDSSIPVDGHEPDAITYDARFDDDDGSYTASPVDGVGHGSYGYDPIPELMTMDGGRRRVRFLSGEYAGRELELPSDGIVIGRDPARANLVLQAAEVSGQHVRVAVDASQGNRLIITDLGSTNGTFLQQPVGHGADWMQVHGSYSASAGMPCRIRLGNGAAELEIS